MKKLYQEYNYPCNIMSPAFFLITIALLAGNVNCGEPHGLIDALNVRVMGSGKHTLVLSHGFGTDQSVWENILPYFLKDFRVVSFDMIFAGTVNPCHFNFSRYNSLDAYADDLLTILDELKVEECVYMGHSMSAIIGCIASLKRPHLFQKLVLLGGSPRYLNDVGYIGGFKQRDTDQLLHSMQSGYIAWASDFALKAVGADFPAAVNDFRRTLKSMRPKISWFVLKTVLESDMRDILSYVKVECLVIQSKRDFVVPVAVAEYLKAHLGGKAWVDILQTNGHLPQLSAPHLLIEALTPILAD